MTKNISFRCLTNKPAEIQLVNLASEVLNFDYNGNKKEAFIKSKDFFISFLIYITGHEPNYKDKDEAKTDIKSSLKKIYDKNLDYNTNEIWICLRRIKYAKLSELPEFSVNHTCGLIYDIILSLNLVSIDDPSMDIYLKKTTTNYKKYLNPTAQEYIFPATNKIKYKGYKRSFYDNAYRAEFYVKLNKELGLIHGKKEGLYDAYTPLILFRMAVEQYCKYLCDKYKVYRYIYIYPKIPGTNKYDKNKKPIKKLGDVIPDTPKVCLDRLVEENILNKFEYNELRCILVRGNLNTHQAECATLYQLAHSKKVIEWCGKRILK